MKLEQIAVQIIADVKVAPLLVKSLGPDSGGETQNLENLFIMKATFQREAKARAWIESEVRLITTILKTLDDGLP